MNGFYIAFGLPLYLFISWIPGLWSFQQMFYGNGIFVGCILNFDDTTIFYLFAMLLSSITFTQHHSLFLGFAICKYIVYTITKRMICTYSYYLCHATSLPNVRQHHLLNLDLLSQCPTLGSTSSIVRTMHPLSTGVPSAVSMKVDMGLRPWCSSSMPYYILCISGLLSTFDYTLELRGSLHKKIFHPSFLSFIKKTN